VSETINAPDFDHLVQLQHDRVMQAMADLDGAYESLEAAVNSVNVDFESRDSLRAFAARLRSHAELAARGVQLVLGVAGAYELAAEATLLRCPSPVKEPATPPRQARTGKRRNGQGAKRKR